MNVYFIPLLVIKVLWYIMNYLLRLSTAQAHDLLRIMKIIIINNFWIPIINIFFVQNVIASKGMIIFLYFSIFHQASLFRKSRNIKAIYMAVHNYRKFTCLTWSDSEDLLTQMKLLRETHFTLNTWKLQDFSTLVSKIFINVY